jgi:hypothetical protein
MVEALGIEIRKIVQLRELTSTPVQMAFRQST